MRKPSKPRRPEKPTRENVAKRLSKQVRYKFESRPTLEKILERVPKHSNKPHQVRLVCMYESYYGRKRGTEVTVQTEPNPDILEEQLVIATKKYKEDLPKFEERWKTYEAKLQDWKEWKYSKVMKEIRDA